MKKCSVSDEEIRRMENYLKGYGLNRKLLRLERYEKEYFGFVASPEDLPGEAPLARARMFEVRHFIMSMKNSDEKLLLYYHYVRGEPVEKCAELLGISRASGFRLKKRALARAVRYAGDAEDAGDAGDAGDARYFSFAKEK
ncbi:MAG: hypothetical protein IJW44_04620 [Clostridia bacterium]|nr:hypothetical protein [Clostridia bacterium]